MQKNHEAYYQPYASDSDDSSSMSSSDSSDSSESMYEDPITSTTFLRQLGAINLDSKTKQLELRTQPKAGKGVDYSPFDLSGTKSDLPFTGTSFNMVDGTYTSILMINSRDRDNQVYPQPTYLTLRLPRTYRNIVSFQITQMKLLSSFFYFRPDKNNVSLQILEQGRTLLQGGQTVDNVITVTIRTGSYDINSLLTELQTQLNRTPLFFYYPNGFSDFINVFTSTGDLSLNFNQPGDNFYNSLTQQFVPNPTITSITTTFFASRYAGLSTYTLAQVKTAYYYPVLYEMLLDPKYAPTLNLTLTTASSFLLPGETVRSRILYTFQGLNDPVIQEVINNNLNIIAFDNVSILDNYRTLNTFKYSLVNEYRCTYETNNNRIIISTNQLNTSLTNLLNQQTTAALISVLNSCNITLQQYSNLLTSNALYTAVFGNMYNFVQSNFANYFAVNFGTYAPVFYTNVSNSPFLQNGINATGVAKGYSLQLLQSAQEPISSSAQSLKSSPGYWPQIKTSPVDSSNNVLFIGSGLGKRPQDISSTVMNVAYNTYAGAILTNQRFIDNSGNVFISPTFGAGDCVTPIFNSKYTVFRFRSFVRQTLQVETLPLPYYYRYPPITQLNFSNPIPQYFDLSYSYINSPYLVRTDISNIPLTYAQTYTAGRASGLNYAFSVRQPVKYFSFTTPIPSPSVDASGYKYPVTLNFQAVDILGAPTQYASPMDFFVYHDQGAFFADISGYRNESPYNYNYMVESSTDLSNASISFNVIAKNKYYVIARSKDVSFQNTRVRTFLYFPKGTSTPYATYFYNPFTPTPYDTPTIDFPVVNGASYNIIYAWYYDSDFVRLPTASSLQGPDPSSAVYNQFLPISQSALNPIGYDVSGISNDLTDYRGFVNTVLGNDPNKTFSVDPLNQYTFQSLSPYNLTTSNYFYTGSSNSILQPISNTPYIPKTVNTRQFKIVHWYDTNYLPPQQTQIPIQSYNTNQLANAKVFDASWGEIGIFSYDVSGNQGQATGGLNMGQGVPGFGFLPNEGTWDVQSFSFKSAFMELDITNPNYVPDPNNRIKKIAIYPTSFISGQQTNSLNLSDAIAVLKFDKKVKYTPTVQALYGGFDNRGGTYWNFINDTTFTKTSRLTVNGYTPSKTYDFNSNDFYSMIAFDTSGNIVPFYTPMGSYVPYPTVTYPSLQNSNTGYTDSNGTYQAVFSVNPATGCNNFQSFYVPLCNAGYNPADPNFSNFYPQDSNIFQSRYQLSIPIKTSLLHTITPANFFTSSNAFVQYPTNPSITSTMANAYSFLTQDPILVFTKGPYFFWYTSADLMTADLIITSNLNTKYDLSGVGIRGTKLLWGPYSLQDRTNLPFIRDYNPDNIMPRPPPRNSNIFMAFTTNASGSNDLDGIYGLFASRYPTIETPVGVSTSYGYDFSVAKFSFVDFGNDTYQAAFKRVYNTSGPDFRSQDRAGFFNEDDINRNNAAIYTGNYTFTKFFYRENIPACDPAISTCTSGGGEGGYYGSNTQSNLNPHCMIMYSAQTDHLVNWDISGGGKSFWALVEYNQYSVNVIAENCVGTNTFYATKQNMLNCFNPNGYTYPGPPPFPTSRNNYYWNQPNSNITDPNYYYLFDWSFGEDGYLNTLVNTVSGATPGWMSPLPAWSFGIFRTNALTTISDPAYYVITNNNVGLPKTNQAVEYGTNTLTQGGLYNQMYIDVSNNIYLQAGVIPNFTNITYPTSLVNCNTWNYTIYQTSSNQASFLKISSNALFIIDKTANSNNAPFLFYNPRGFNVNGLSKCVSPLLPTLLDRQFPFLSNRAGNKLNTFLDWFPLVPQTISVPFYKNNLTNQTIFIQPSKKQFFWTSVSRVKIDGDLSGVTQQSDISGTYDVKLSFTPTNFFITSNIPAGVNTDQLNSFWARSYSNYSVNPNKFNFCDISYNTTANQYSYKLIPTNFAESLSSATVSIQNKNVFNIKNNKQLSVSIQKFDVSGLNIDMNYPAVSGNNGLTSDILPGTLNNAWNVFYPTTKIVLTKSSSSGSTPITNTYDLIGNPPPPYNTPEHTAMFYYDNYTSMASDLFGKFGQESAKRFKAYDVSSGYGFHSYIYNIPLEAYKGPTRDISANIGYSYLAVRGYSPTEKFDCLTRFYLPGRYDFGFISLQDLSNETQTVLVDLSGSPLVNPNYQNVLNQFNNAFKGNFNFGSNSIAGFGGSNYTLTGWPSFLRTYINTYNTGTSNANLIAQINSNVQSIVSNYIQTYFSEILPSYILTRERFTDPLLFSILFESALLPEYKNLEYEWGLGWNLGFPKLNTPYDTIQRATSFFKILDDYIYLKMNNEFMMNRLDSSGPENYSITHDATGQTNQFTAKLLLAPFGSYAQTMIQNPIIFNPVLTSIDRLTFEWVDLTDTQINNNDCEWNAAVQIVEQVTTASATSTIPKAEPKK